MMMGRRPAAIELAATAVLIACGIDLAGRSMARASWLRLVGLDLDLSTVLVIAGLAAAIPLTRAIRAGRHQRAVAAGLAFAFSAGMAAQLTLAARLQSDGFYYFAYLRSLWFDHDVNLANDYRLLGLDDKPHLFTSTPTGHAQTAWAIGPALMWSPFFAVGDRIAHVKAARGEPVKTDGTSYPYRQAACVAGLFWGLVGLYLCSVVARCHAGAGTAAAAAALVALGSFVIWYLVKEPSMAHAPSLCAVAAFTAWWAATRPHRTTAQWAVLGLLAGVMATVRWQNVLFAALPAVEWLAGALTTFNAGRRLRDLAPYGRGATAFAALAMVGLLPQMLAWKAIYGSWLAVSPISPELRWWDSHWAGALWSSRNGLLAMSPVLYVGLAGLVMLWRRDAIAAAGAWIGLLTMVFLNGAVLDWWGGAAFGGRRFDSTIPLFVLGTAIALEAAVGWVTTHPRAILSLAAAAIVLWNLALVEVAVRGAMELEAPNAFGRLAGERALTLHRWFGHPASYPATLVFAARNGITPAEADGLWPAGFLGDPARPYGRVDVGEGDELWLGDGWFAPERADATGYRWSGRRSTLRLALDHPARLRVQLRGRAFSWPGGPAQSLVLSVNGREQPAVVLSPDWQVVEMVVAAEAWRGGVNRLALTFAHAWRPADIGVSGDRRELAAAIDYLRVQVAE